MNGAILVAYASRAGATAGVAEAIGRTLAEGGAQVEVRPMQEVAEISAYRAVVAGSAIQAAAWLPEAMAFIERHQAALAQRPVATFTVCMTLAMRNGAQYRAAVSEWLAPVRARVHPVSEGIFAGVLDVRQVPGWFTRLKFRISVAVGIWSEGDHRDWAAIRAWAEALGPLLAAAPARAD